MFSFVHCADLHLGSTFSSWRGVRPELARELALAPFADFEKLADAAKAQGMDPATADALALSTLIGTAKLLSGSDTTPEELRRRVTSKKGTTEAGVGAMLAAGFEKAVADGFNAARIRSDELSKD